MAIDSHYIPAFSIEDVILDKDTGAPLSGGLVYFEQDNQRGVLKPVYQITGTSPNYSYTQLPNPMTLSSIGTFEDSLGNPVIPYFFPYDSSFNPEYYFVRVTSSEDVPQFTREAVPYIPAAGSNSVTSAFVNELSNPQFAEVFFPSPTTYSFNAVTDEVVAIAPGWDIVVTSPAAGTVTLSILTPTGSLNRLTNPGTILNLNSTGLTSFRLRQRIYGSPNLWGSGYLSGTFIAKTYAGTASTLTMLYSQSNGSVVDQVIRTATLTADGVYAAFPGSVLIPASSSTEFFPLAYIDIEFNIPLSTEIDISSVMIAATGDVSVDNIIYDQTTLDRQIDQLFHYYKPQLDFKPIPSYLVGWDFPLNPALANGDGVTAPAVANAYTWDQTILFQSTVSRVATSRANNGAMVLTVTGGATQAALIQYIPQAIARNLLENRLSVNICADGENLLGTVSLWYTTNANVPTLPLSLITTLDANGHPSAVAAGWTELTRDTGLGNAEFTLVATLENYGFNGWNARNTTLPNTTTFFAIVVGTASMPDGTACSFNSISLVPGDIPTIPAPQTLDEVIRECQYYYEKSYPVFDVPGTMDANGALSAEMLSIHVGGSDQLISRQFSFRYNTQKYSDTPVVVLYELSGTANQVSGYLYSSGAQVATGAIAVAGNWNGVFGNMGAVYTPANVTALLATAVGATTTSEAFIEFQFTSDSRLGVV